MTSVTCRSGRPTVVSLLMQGCFLLRYRSVDAPDASNLLCQVAIFIHA